MRKLDAPYLVPNKGAGCNIYPWQCCWEGEDRNIAPQVYRKGKPMFPEISDDIKLSDLIGPESWQILEVAGVTRSGIREWAESGFVADSFITFVKQLTCINSCSKHNISLVQDFSNSFHSEPKYQNCFQVVRSNRKTFTKTLKKKTWKPSNLIKVWCIFLTKEIQMFLIITVLRVYA